MKKTKFTHEVYQNEMEIEDIEYVVKKHQPYFEFEIEGKKCLIGLDMILECIIVAEKVGEIPPLGNGFWVGVSEKFDLNYYEYEVNLYQE